MVGCHRLHFATQKRHDFMTATNRWEHWDVRFSGQVQGVGFRYTTRGLAARFPVVGYVKNLRDGTVELVIEGAPEALKRLVSLVETEMSGNITQTQIDKSEPTGAFDTFEIAH